MGATLEDMIKAGALRQLCHYFDSIGGKEEDWIKVEEFAMREFREVPPLRIKFLIVACKVAVRKAQECNSENV